MEIGHAALLRLTRRARDPRVSSLRKKDIEGDGSQLTGWFTPATQVPEVKANVIIQGRSGKDVRSGVRRYLRKQYDEYGRIIREANIKTE